MALTKITSTNIQAGAIESSSLETSGATAGTYGSASLIPVLSVNAQGIVYAISETTVAGVTNFAYDSGTEVLTISTADGGSFTADVSSLASQTYVDTAVSNLVDTAPEALNTLNELAAALGDDANFATTVSTNLGNKVDKINITGATVGSGTEIPVITFNAQGQITSTTTTAVAGIGSVTFTNGTLTIAAGDGTNYTTDFDARYFTETEANSNFLGINAKAADADLFDGLNSTQFLRSDSLTNLTSGGIKFYDNSSERGRLLADASLYIGTTTPSSFWDIRNNSGNAFFALDRTNTRVGIGTTSPGEKLVVVSDSLNQFNYGYRGSLIIDRTADENLDDTSSPIPADRYWPQGNLMLADGNTWNTDTNGPGLSFYKHRDGDGNQYVQAFIGARGVWGSNNTDLRFYVNNSGSANILPTSPQMVIDGANGNVGIGTDSPSQKFTVYNGNILLDGPSGSDPKIEFHQPTNTGEGGVIVYNDADEVFTIASRMATYGDINFAIGMNDGDPTDLSYSKMFIKANGNVGIGTTGPSANLEINPSGADGSLKITSDANSGHNVVLTQVLNTNSKPVDNLKWGVGGTAII